MKALSIREATIDDIEFLVSVLLLADRDRLATTDGWDSDRFVDRSRAATTEEVAGKVENSSTYVVEADTTPVGRLRVVRSREGLLIAGIQILPVHQRKGIGSELIRSVIGEAKQKALPVRLEVVKASPDAKRFYLRLGFEVIQDRDDRELMEMRFDA